MASNESSVVEVLKRRPKAVSRLKQPYHNVAGTKVMLTDQQYQFTQAALITKDSETLINRVREIYQTDAANARVIARENFQKPNIELYLGDRGYKALDVLHQAMLEAPSWTDKIRAADSLADRQFGKATQRIEQQTNKVSININLNATDTQQIEDN